MCAAAALQPHWLWVRMYDDYDIYLVQVEETQSIHIVGWVLGGPGWSCQPLVLLHTLQAPAVRWNNAVAQRSAARDAPSADTYIYGRVARPLVCVAGISVGGGRGWFWASLCASPNLMVVYCHQQSSPGSVACLAAFIDFAASILALAFSPINATGSDVVMLSLSSLSGVGPALSTAAGCPIHHHCHFHVHVNHPTAWRAGWVGVVGVLVLVVLCNVITSCACTQ